MPKGYIDLRNHQAIGRALQDQLNARTQDWVDACDEVQELKKELKRADELYDQATQRIDQLIEQCNKKQAEINQLKKEKRLTQVRVEAANHILETMMQKYQQDMAYEFSRRYEENNGNESE